MMQTGGKVAKNNRKTSGNVATICAAKFAVNIQKLVR
jgi:hypothetical protein